MSKKTKVAKETTGRVLKYDPTKILALWEKGKSIKQIAEAMSPISLVFVHRTLVTKYPKQYSEGQKARAAAREAAKKAEAK
jgi:ABC-type glutathione transport system ATPase component